jgi:hypothetical protein
MGGPHFSGRKTHVLYVGDSLKVLKRWKPCWVHSSQAIRIKLTAPLLPKRSPRA